MTCKHCQQHKASVDGQIIDISIELKAVENSVKDLNKNIKTIKSFSTQETFYNLFEMLTTRLNTLNTTIGPERMKLVSDIIFSGNKPEKKKAVLGFKIVYGHIYDNLRLLDRTWNPGQSDLFTNIVIASDPRDLITQYTGQLLNVFEKFQYVLRTAVQDASTTEQTTGVLA